MPGAAGQKLAVSLMGGKFLQESKAEQLRESLEVLEQVSRDLELDRRRALKAKQQKARAMQEILEVSHRAQLLPSSIRRLADWLGRSLLQLLSILVFHSWSP